MRRAVAPRTALLAVVGLVAVAAIALGLYVTATAPSRPGSTGTTGTGTASTTPPATGTVSISGMVNATGQGTTATKVTFSGSSGTVEAIVASGQYRGSLPAPATYTITVHWVGNYSWQSGDISLGTISVNTTVQSVVQNLQAPTPDSKVIVSGSIVASGLGTLPRTVIFSYGGSNYTSPASNGGYSVGLPNLATYTVFVHWSGSYSWQAGDVRVTLLQVNVQPGSKGLTQNLGASTPNSVIDVSGSVVASGVQTDATTITFADSAGDHFSTTVSAGQFSVQLPNLATFAVQVQWRGAYSWQGGTVTAGPTMVNQPAGVRNQTVRLGIATPNSVLNVSGSVGTTGSGTHPTGLKFVTGTTTINANVSGGQYSAKIPNIANYSVFVQWAGTYSWQSGSVLGGTVGFNLSAGVGSSMANFMGSTPNSVITVSGKVSTVAGTTPTLITFTANGQQYTMVPSGGTYTIQLPNAAVYTIAISWSGNSQSGVCHPTLDTYSLQTAPGTTSVAGVDWSC